MKAIEWWRNRLGVSMIKVSGEEFFYTECPCCHTKGDTMRVSEKHVGLGLKMECDYCGAREWAVCDKLGYSREVLLVDNPDLMLETHMRRAKKPPLGIPLRYLWEEERRQKIRKAITEYMAADLMVPECWIEEWNELTSGGKVDLIAERLED